MRRSLLSALMLGSILVAGCDPTSDDFALSLDPATYPAVGADEVPHLIAIHIEGIRGGMIKLPACVVDLPIGKVPVLDLERLEGDAWVLKQSLGSCDPESTSELMTMYDTGDPHFRTPGPKEAGTYRWSLWVQTADGDRKVIHSPELTVTGE